MKKLVALRNTLINSILLILIFNKDAMAIVNLGIPSVMIVFVAIVYSSLIGLIPTYFIYRKYKNKKIWYLTPIVGAAIYAVVVGLYYLFL